MLIYQPGYDDAQDAYDQGAEDGREKPRDIEPGYKLAHEPQEKPIYYEGEEPEGKEVYGQRQDEENGLYEEVKKPEENRGLYYRAVAGYLYAWNQVVREEDPEGKDAKAQYYARHLFELHLRRVLGLTGR